jgi:hypothetical protein
MFKKQMQLPGESIYCAKFTCDSLALCNAASCVVQWGVVNHTPSSEAVLWYVRPSLRTLLS